MKWLVISAAWSSSGGLPLVIAPISAVNRVISNLLRGSWNTLAPTASPVDTFAACNTQEDLECNVIIFMIAQLIRGARHGG
jgi:hypothetical protein